MYYAPHILQRQIVSETGEDEYGRPIESIQTDEWEDICPCRCDMSSETVFKDERGNEFSPDYHVVCEGPRLKVRGGDKVRCLLKNSDTVVGEGTVIKIHPLNMLPYAEFWM